MIAADHAPQVITLAVALAGLVVWTVWVRKNRAHWLYAVPPMTWLLHVAIFYMAVFVHAAGHALPVDYVLWSAAIRLQAAFSLAGIGVVMYRERIVVKR